MTFNIYFSGTLEPGHDKASVQAALQQRMKLSEEQAAKLFSGARILIKRNLEEASAQKYVKVMASLGATVDVSPPLPAAAPAGFTLEPIAAPPAPEPATDEPIQPYAAPASAAPANSVFCRQCGTALPAVAQHCHQCGAAQAPGNEKNRFVAALLAFFLGWLGAHRLYLGQWWGILYVLIYPIMWLVSLIEAVVFLCTPQSRWLKKYGNVPPSNAWLIAVVGLFGFICIVGILAAIAIPAYQDYTVRAKVNEAMLASSDIRSDIDDFYRRTGYLPSSNIEIGLEDEVHLNDNASVEVIDDGNLVLYFSGIAAIEGQALIWQPEQLDESLAWHCTGGDLRDRYRPAHCRGGDGATTGTSASPSSASPTATTAKPAPGKLTTWHSDDQIDSLQVRGDWARTDMEDATLALLNERDDIGVLVVREHRLDFEPGFTLADYLDISLEYNFSEMTHLEVEPMGDAFINGVPAKLVRTSGYINGIAVTFLNAVLETDERFYRVSAWTGTSAWPHNQATLQAVIDSFEIAGYSISRQP